MSDRENGVGIDDAVLRRHCLAALISEPLLVALFALLMLGRTASPE